MNHILGLIEDRIAKEDNSGFNLACVVCTSDKQGRKYIQSEFRTVSSESVREPSRAWPNSEFKHAMTLKFAKQLREKLLEEDKKAA